MMTEEYSPYAYIGDEKMKKEMRIENYCFQPSDSRRIFIQLFISLDESETEKAKEINQKVENLVSEAKSLK